jgi:hypothetical protein
MALTVRFLRGLAFGTGLLAALVLILEIAFRVAGWSVSAAPTPTADGSRVVLCVGDSHTRGRPDPDNYPTALEQMLKERTTERWRVINLGVPGQNTGQVRRRFERYLAYYRPAVVLHWGGVNNSWNQAERDGADHGLLARIAERSRLVRMVRVAIFYRGLGQRMPDTPTATGHDWGTPADGVRINFAGVDDDIARRPSRKLPGDEIAALTRQDLEAMMRLAWSHDVPMYLVTYSWWGEGFDQINAAVVDVSAEFNVPYVDSAKAMDIASREHPGEQLFDAWVHPMPILYRQIAAQAYELLVAQAIARARD